VFGTLTVPVTWAVGRRLFCAPAALLAAALVALSPMALYYSLEARAYATAMFFAIASLLALLRALDAPSRGRWVLYGVLAWAALLSHYTTVFVIGTQALWALWCFPARRRAVLITHAVVAVAYVPWLPFLKSTDLLHAIEVLLPLTTRSFFQ